MLIDIHCHILPFVDDGPRDWDESLRMAMVAVNNGIHTIIATPHHGKNRYYNSANKIVEQVTILNEILHARSIPLVVKPGQEFYLSEDYKEQYEQGNLQKLGNSSFLLVELPERNVPDYFDEFIADMYSRSIQIVIAHPERYSYVIKKPSILSEWIKKGLLLQVNASSLLGLNGRTIQKTAVKICKLSLHHFIASDAHNTMTRGFYLRESYHKLTEIMKSEFKGFYNRADFLLEKI
ncbi:hypothetical protein E0485_10980 [Paenibacillus albiflavus]|uniref:Tyrosine-protein phosphatase n=1 Tax=Paenibacillus albiflavus TaxID=2545760 RepID=A0A4R4EC39_9BACL|nr:CpsB/CapC family capsule biosynthesis tyrosine phosphatase [Paenibacillus albiflavus]TCZ77506.1 hypothetical protein E0485_10980 [Paenibacillus albiflavus]